MNQQTFAAGALPLVCAGVERLERFALNMKNSE